MMQDILITPYTVNCIAIPGENVFPSRTELIQLQAETNYCCVVYSTAPIIAIVYSPNSL